MKENVKEYQTVYHTFEPVYRADSELLILGSFPSVKSREQGFYYGNPQNRFWRVLSMLYGEECPTTVQEKKELLYRRKIALWDVLASCDIVGSSDASIRNAVPVEIRRVLEAARIQKIFTNGKTADGLYRRYLLAATGQEAVALPSTSPANASFTLERLCGAWGRELRSGAAGHGKDAFT